ncbi:c-type cytochrome [Spirosoma agri]|uniref:C-type cytochrome n=1 Tax=Spirosoma agri TaxID=1987381 RepID=A0A6M0ICG2_9BACT|nr:c-type cytochrome [Spirosoma agri]NEU65788.1 c-type cytochrome [Spirosoma agri]
MKRQLIKTRLIFSRKVAYGFAGLIVLGAGLLALTPPIYWRPPADSRLPAGALGKEIRYGRELIAHTAKYLGPAGSVKHLSNGMNCQNCHLEAGTKVLGNNYAAVFSTYPKFRERSGSTETIVKRVSDCFERSLGGTAPDSTSREMKAIVAYMRWLGSDVPQGQRPDGVGLTKLAFLDRAADSTKGQLVYAEKCQVCHGAKGEGMKTPGSSEYVYPPMWGPHSYNDGAGLYRLSNFAGYVKNNMPFGASYASPQLTDEEAWDVAAFINAMPRPHKNQGNDWPRIASKPIDFPFGPYADPFSEHQHKFGPFQPIADARKVK